MDQNQETAPSAAIVHSLNLAAHAKQAVLYWLSSFRWCAMPDTMYCYMLARRGGPRGTAPLAPAAARPLRLVAPPLPAASASWSAA